MNNKIIPLTSLIVMFRIQRIKMHVYLIKFLIIMRYYQKLFKQIFKLLCLNSVFKSYIVIKIY